jgi:hypothetical protein
MGASFVRDGAGRRRAAARARMLERQHARRRSDLRGAAGRPRGGSELGAGKSRHTHVQKTGGMSACGAALAARRTQGGVAARAANRDGIKVRAKEGVAAAAVAAGLAAGGGHP